MDGRLWVRGDRILGDFPDRSMWARLSMTTCAYANPQKKWSWSWPATPWVVASQVERLQGCDIQFDKGWMDLYEQYRSEREHFERWGAGFVLPVPSKTGSWDHQIRAWSLLQGMTAGGLFADMGTGKTKVAVDLLLTWPTGDVLIVAPKKVVQNRVWPRELETHALYPYDAVTLDGTLKSRVEALDTPVVDADGGTRTVFITNYEALVYADVQKAVDRHAWAGIILDEAHRIKSASSQTSRFLAKLGLKTKRRLALTGTPASDKPLDVFGIYRFLDPGVFGTYFGKFQERYAVTVTDSNRRGEVFKRIVGYQNQEELSERMYRLAFRVDSSVLDLPPQHDVVVPVEISDARRKLYKKMRDDFVISEGKDDLIAPNKITVFLRLQQLTSGYADFDGEVKRYGTEKRDTLQEIMEDLPEDEPLVVFARFHEDLDSIHHAALEAGRHSFELSGRKDELETWQRSAGGQVLAVQIQAGGSGVDLTRACHVVYFSHSFSLTDYEQSRKRTHRPGQTRPVTYHHLVVPNSIDEYIMEALREKKNVTDYVTERMQ